MSKELIIKHYENVLFENYPYYLIVIDEINSQIEPFTDELNKTLDTKINEKDVVRFNYHSFCNSFLENLNIELEDDSSITPEKINNIFMYMIEDRILEGIELEMD